MRFTTRSPSVNVPALSIMVFSWGSAPYTAAPAGAIPRVNRRGPSVTVNNGGNVAAVPQRSPSVCRDRTWTVFGAPAVMEARSPQDDNRLYNVVENLVAIRPKWDFNKLQNSSRICRCCGGRRRPQGRAHASTRSHRAAGPCAYWGDLAPYLRRSGSPLRCLRPPRRSRRRWALRPPPRLKQRL